LFKTIFSSQSGQYALAIALPPYSVHRSSWSGLVPTLGRAYLLGVQKPGKKTIKDVAKGSELSDS
jgi:hypothetical protein